MSQKNEHRRILLNKNQSGVVEYCEQCEVVELEIGPVSIRLQAQDLELFSTLIQEADTRLRYYNIEKSRYEAEVVKVGGMH
ncbi:MAG: DUF6686 family protein [Methylophilaceae bacterium]